MTEILGFDESDMPDIGIVANVQEASGKETGGSECGLVAVAQAIAQFGLDKVDIFLAEYVLVSEPCESQPRTKFFYENNMLLLCPLQSRLPPPLPKKKKKDKALRHPAVECIPSLLSTAKIRFQPASSDALLS